jgi:hypothetical protein
MTPNAYLKLETTPFRSALWAALLSSIASNSLPVSYNLILLNLSLTFINAFPNLFLPHSSSFPSAFSASNPIPQIRSLGLASTKISSPVFRRISLI